MTTEPLAPAVDAGIARDVILIGASAGGIQAISQLLSELPRNIRAAIAITLHRSPVHRSMLAGIFGARSKLPVVEPEGGELFAPGRIFVAPPDRHLVFRNGVVLLDAGPKESHSRPSIDVMFRSGAENFGRRVIGVILTGNLKDGVAGLTAITRHGGLSVVQEPAEAVAPSMPLHAVAYDNVNIVFRLAAAGEVLGKLAAGQGIRAALEIPGTRRVHELLPA